MFKYLNNQFIIFESILLWVSLDLSLGLLCYTFLAAYNFISCYEIIFYLKIVGKIENFK